MIFSKRSIPAAAAMTALLIFGAGAQAQTTANPPTNAQGGAAVVPKGPDSMPKSTEQRDMKKPMAKEGDKAGMSNKGDKAGMSDKGDKAGMSNKGDKANMPAGRSSKPMADKSKMQGETNAKGKSGQPAGSTSTGGSATPPAGPNTSTKDAAGMGTSK